VSRARIFPPWFLSRAVLREIELLVPAEYHRRFRAYFDRHGCVRCERREVPYGCNGLCLACVGLVSDRLKRIDKKMEKRQLDREVEDRGLLRRRELARELLADFRGVVTPHRRRH
jgi:hypothetical protein